MIFFLALLLTAAVGCGSSDDHSSPPPSEQGSATTSYGTLAEVSEYLQAVNPYIHLVGELQMEVDTVVGTSGRATGQNLAAAMAGVQPRLKEMIERFEQIAPPPLLAPLHRDIKKLMLVRLEAYETTIEGWKREQESQDLGLYKEAEAQLVEANQMIQELNDDLKAINSAIQIARNSQDSERVE